MDFCCSEIHEKNASSKNGVYMSGMGIKRKKVTGFKKKHVRK